ncbi:MAG: MATE family efflux transporter, partial [Oscillospiraceae bacterium]|nr:MATE family efflux transporter [Oscillospiraceae bacterium]
MEFIKNHFVTDRKFYKSVIAIALPIALQNVISFGVNIMDSLMLGQLGDLAISGANLGGQPFFLLMMIGFGLSSGGSVLIAQYWGKGDVSSIKKVMGISMRFVTVASVLFTVICLAFPQQLMHIFSNEPEVVEAATQYMTTLAFSYIFYSISNSYLMSLRAVEQVKVSTCIYSISFFVNVFFNYCFIFGKFGAPRLEIRGAAVGTVLARVTEFILMLLYMNFVEKKVKFRIKDCFKFDTSLMSDYVRHSLPVVGNELMWGLGMTITNIIIGHIGQVFVAANSIANVVNQLSGVFVFGVANAAAVLTGKAIGAGHKKQAQRIANTLWAMVLALGCCGCVVLLCIRGPILSLYAISDEARAAAYGVITVLACVQPSFAIDATSIVGILRGGGDTRTAFAIDCGGLWLISIPLGLLAGFVLKLP